MFISPLPSLLLLGDHLAKVTSGGDLGDSEGVSLTLPDMSSDGGESRGETKAAGVVAFLARPGRRGVLVRSGSTAGGEGV